MKSSMQMGQRLSILAYDVAKSREARDPKLRMRETKKDAEEEMKKMRNIWNIWNRWLDG